MKMLSLLITTMLLSAPLSSIAEEKNTRIVITTDKEVSYALGIKIAQKWRDEGLVVDPNIVALAINDVQNHGPRRLSSEAGRQAIYIEKDRIKRASDAVWKARQTAAREFMKNNKNAEGVATTDSGLQYVIQEPGTGAVPSENSSIVVSYTGISATKGNIFSRVKAPQDGSTFSMNSVIDGWKEGLQLIKEGGKITLYVPAHLAYGRDGIKHRKLYVIEPNDALVFDIELIKVSN
ncbi:MAG: FKBP-type peptidyl-prolyl cis-trans isomerase [Thiotrichales bacterium]|nr:FKBP-type peptidyl-prolyl cis-trans isomerase [Thiotrichales bacterium]